MGLLLLGCWGFLSSTAVLEMLTKLNIGLASLSYMQVD